MTWDMELERRLRKDYALPETAKEPTIHAPYKIVKRDGMFCVMNNIGEVKAKFKTHEQALAYQRALYANVKGAAKMASEHKWTGKEKVKAWATTDGFVTELSDHRLLLTAPASTFSSATDLPAELAEAWNRQSKANPYFMWVQGRFVEAEQANSNGAYWSTGDLEFGEMGVRHGPLNWLHQSRKVIGTIADGRLIHPQRAGTFTTTASSSTNLVMVNGVLQQAARERPFIAATAAVWKWLYPDEARDVEMASASGKLYYSMECVAEQIQCAGARGCGESFDYLKAVTDPTSTCGHIRERSSVRRMVNPSFLGGAVIVPPLTPGWRDASATVVRQAASMAEATHSANHHGLTPEEWEGLMAAVLAPVMAP